MKKIADIRKDYMLKSFTEADAEANAIKQFTSWWNDAISSEIDEVNALTLSTATKDGKPSARIVLLKGYDNNGFVFFTNYNSNKGLELAANPQACMVFFWKELERQVKVEGIIEKLTDAENDEYYFSRPIGSQVGAWSSPQSEVIASRSVIEENVKKYEAQFTTIPITRPPHWGGYRLKPHLIEFWQGRPNRLHDRLQYTLQHGTDWKLERLAP
ncbi:MAG: pyridoxamine 5'-phosphate oxidase [Chitinophagaceae bacterium]|nr:pyridoxamine 5'-phosphate oxidase [Chitinophagaceae bacterium]